MTVINLTVLADALGNATPIDAVLEAEATSARVAGAEARTPRKIVVPITAGAPAAPLNLETTGIGWCWKLVLMVPATGYRITRFVQVPATGTVTWEDLVDVNPLTLKVLPDAVPAWKAAMDALLAARDAAVLAVTDAVTVQVDAQVTPKVTAAQTARTGAETARDTAVTAATTASTQAGLASGSAVAANQAEVAAGIARDESVAAKDLAISTVADVALTADTALTNAALAQTKADAAVPVHLSIPLGDLNDLMEIGLYRQSNGMYATLANNYPLSGLAYLIEVLPGGGSAWRVQRATAFVSGNKTATFVRTFIDSWGAWQHLPAQRIDNTAGRAIYTWDETLNREQRIFADTGWRDIQTLLHEDLVLSPSAPALRMRREGNRVSLLARVSPKAGGVLVGKGKTSAFIFIPTLPQGFRGTSYTAIGVGIIGSQGNPVFLNTVGSPTTIAAVGSTSNSGVWATTDTLSAEISWTTNDEWPTSLPGTAVSTIPHN